MNRPVLILGTGKMARNIGVYLLAHGHAVTWYSEHAAYLVECESHVAKAVRRIKRINGDAPETAFVGAGGTVSGAPYLLIEATHESLDKKRKALAAFPNLPDVPGVVLLSASSSLLPSDIHPNCIGCHFFYPVELTGVVELILPDSGDGPGVEAVRTLLAEVRLAAIEQTSKNAFAVNRLLLPLQNEVFRLLIAGYDPLEIDAASASAYCPLGQCSLMDTVGLDIIHASVVNYLSRMSAAGRTGYRYLIDGLHMMTAAKKYGQKNGNGLCAGDPLPWKSNGLLLDRHNRDILRNTLRLTCKKFVADGRISEASLALALSSVFNTDTSLHSVER